MARRRTQATAPPSRLSRVGGWLMSHPATSAALGVVVVIAIIWLMRV